MSDKLLTKMNLTFSQNSHDFGQFVLMNEAW